MNETNFEMWSATHLLTIATITVLTISVILRGRSLPPDDRVYFGRRLGLVVALFFIFEYSWRFLTYGFISCVEQEMLPLHFCAFMSLICIIALWWQLPWASALVYYGVLSASIQAIFTPVLKADFPSISFMNFFISHSLLLITALVQILVLGWRSRRRDPFLAVLLMNLYIIAIHPLNLQMGTNYGFTTHGPEGTILAQLGPAPWYYLWLELPALLLFCLMYIPVRASKSAAHP